jgi:hypothetical protein
MMGKADSDSSHDRAILPLSKTDDRSSVADEDAEKKTESKRCRTAWKMLAEYRMKPWVYHKPADLYADRK